MKPTVIYHSSDYDGKFCYEIAKRFIGTEADYIGWDFGHPPIPIPPQVNIFVMDLPVDKPFGLDFSIRDGRLSLDFDRVIWIDHHKTSIESHPKEIPGYRIEGVAACRLAWQWFSKVYKNSPLYPDLPAKHGFLNRVVEEPMAVTLVGEYDVWDHKASQEKDITFQFGLNSESNLRYDILLSKDGMVAGQYVYQLLEVGAKAQTYQENMDRFVLNNSFMAKWEGLNFLCVNSPYRNSNLFKSKDFPETGHDAFLAFYNNGKGFWIVSLYHAAHRKDLDLSEIAKRFGGGGHKGACGFQIKSSAQLPFLLQHLTRP